MTAPAWTDLMHAGLVERVRRLKPTTDRLYIAAALAELDRRGERLDAQDRRIAKLEQALITVAGAFGADAPELTIIENALGNVTEARVRKAKRAALKARPADDREVAPTAKGDEEGPCAACGVSPSPTCGICGGPRCDCEGP